MSWWTSRADEREQLARIARVGSLIEAIGRTVDQLKDRLDRIEKSVENDRRVSATPAESPERSDRIETLTGEVKRLQALEAAQFDPTEKKRYLDYLVTLGGLKPDHAVLDVGCGPGRIAKELTRYLRAGGSYHGIEVQGAIVDHLRTVHSGRPNFHFHHADIHNTNYNEAAAASPAEYRFPLPDESVQVVVLRSVFTHMLPPEIDNYMREIARVLTPGGRSLITYYLLNEQSRPFVDSRPRPVSAAYPYDGRGSFPHDYGTYRVRYEEVPERAVALDEPFVRALYARHGLQIVEPIQYGSWSGRMHYLSGQDIVVAEKAW